MIWFKEFCTRTMLVLASTLLTLLLLEVAIRLFMPQQLILLRRDIWIPADTIGWRMAPDIDTRVNTGEGEVRLVTDEDGNRTLPLQRPDATYRVLALGDSFIAALQVEYEQTMTALLEESLSTRLQEPTRVDNTGVGGWDPNHYLIEARHELTKTNYNAMVIFLFMPNDVISNKVERFLPKKSSVKSLRIPRSMAMSEWIDAVAYPINNSLESHSHLYILLKERGWFILMKLGFSARRFSHVFQKSFADDPAWQTTAERCADIAATAPDIPVLFVLLPGVYQVDQTISERYMLGLGIDPSTADVNQPAAILMKELTDRNLHVIDATEALHQALVSDEKEIYGKVDTHLAPEGHRVVASLVEPVLVEMLTQKSVAPTLTAPLDVLTGKTN